MKAGRRAARSRPATSSADRAASRRPSTALARSVRPGDRLLLADGLVELRVDGTDGTEIETTVVEGGQIGEHKGINAPGVPLPASAITPKDIEDLQFGLDARRRHGGAQLRAERRRPPAGAAAAWRDAARARTCR